MPTKSSKGEQVKAEIKKEIEKIPPTTDQNMLGALSYVWIVSVLMLLVKRDNEFVQFHAKQGVILFLGTLVAFIPVLGWAVWMLSVLGMVFGFVQAWSGKRYQLPIVHGLSQKINI